MTKVKRIVVIAVISIISIIVLVDTVFVITLCQTINNMMDYPETYFPAMARSNSYVKIDDVGYLPVDVVMLDPERVESGDIKVYSSGEISKIINEAIAKRDGVD